MERRFIAWRRVAAMMFIFGLTFAAVVWIWRTRPPTSVAVDAAINGRNAPGDFNTVTVRLSIELLVALVACQPWTPGPRRRWLAVAGLLFGAWGIIHFLVGLHAPPVMLPHDVLMLLLGLGFGGAALMLRSSQHSTRGSGTAT